MEEEINIEQVLADLKLMKDKYFINLPGYQESLDYAIEKIKYCRELEESKKSKPYWEQIMNKEKMTIEEAEIIIDDMYQDRNKIIATKNDKGVTVHLDRLDDVKFTNLEFASVRVLREIQSLRRKLENSIQKSKVKEKIDELEKDRNAIKKEIEEAIKEKDKEYHADLLRHLHINYGEKKALQELMEDK